MILHVPVVPVVKSSYRHYRAQTIIKISTCHAYNVDMV